MHAVRRDGAHVRHETYRTRHSAMAAAASRLVTQAGTLAAASSAWDRERATTALLESAVEYAARVRTLAGSR